MASATALGLGGVDTRTICSCRGLVEKARLGIEERADVFEGNAIIGRLHFTNRAPRPEPSSLSVTLELSRPSAQRDLQRQAEKMGLFKLLLAHGSSAAPRTI